MATTIVARKPMEGDAYWVLGGLYEVKVASAETDDAMVVMHVTIPDGMGPPPHSHQGAETVYILDGMCQYRIGDGTVEGEVGSVFHIPAGVWEAFQPVGTMRALIVYTPGNKIDEFFAEVGEHALARELPPPSVRPADLEQVIAAGARHGLEVRAPA